MQEEIWKKTDRFSNYSVSTLGNIRNDVTNKLLKLCVKGGYYHISLVSDTERKTYKVHRLVALAFIPNNENKSDVNHKDKNKLNNSLDNLEWMTRQENNKHRCAGVKITSNKNKPINCKDKKTNAIVATYNSIEDAGKWAVENNLSKTLHNARNSIGNCVRGESKSAFKFCWEFVDKYEDLEGEEWRQVVIPNVDLGDKTYFVSNLGRHKNSFGVIPQNYKVNENGYIRVLVGTKAYALHRLVAFAFIPNPKNKSDVNHKDGNKLNNAVTNLEWLTCSENQQHKHDTGLANQHSRKIVQFDANMNKIKEFPSIVSASKELNTAKSNIRGVLINNRKTAKGFIFKYLEDC